MPANLTTLLHFSVSSEMIFPNSMGAIGVGTAPKSPNCAISVGSARAALTSALSFAMISAGVRLGAQMPNQVFAS